MQKEIQLTDKTLLVVSVPEEASDLTLPKVGIVDLYFQKKGNNHIEEDSYISIGLPSTSYEFLSIAEEMTEHKARMIMPRLFFAECRPTKLYVNFLDETSYVSNALESFQSLMERENITGYDKYAILIKSK